MGTYVHKKGDAAFREEEQILETVSERVKGKIYDLRDGVYNRQREIEGWMSIDVEDAENKAYEKRKINRDIDEIDDLESAYRSLYFGHMELRGEGAKEQERVLIGKEPVYMDGDVLITKWNAPLAQRFYVKNKSSFRVRGTSYELDLRRRVDISEDVLRGCVTEYDRSRDGEVSGAAGISEGVTETYVADPFLQKVLEERRLGGDISDIIRTIQQNQYTIISAPANENIIVQGCAGSGKTMIMLHRLVFLRDNSGISISKTKIVTPSNDFASFVEGIGISLGINDIERLTIREYYKRLISLYSGEIDVGGKTFSEASTSIGDELLQEVYSMDFVGEIKAAYSAYWDNIERDLKNIDAANVLSFFFTDKYSELYQANFDDYTWKRPDITPCYKYLKDRSPKTVLSWKSCYEYARGMVDAIESKKAEILARKKGGQENLDNEKGWRRSKVEARIHGYSEQLIGVEELLPKNLKDFRKIGAILLHLSPDRLVEAVSEKVLHAVYERHSKTLTKKNYQHKLYIKLVVCQLYFGNISSAKADAFVNIDEAQDLSVAELMLLKQVLGNDCIFNLYGDVNQEIYGYKGILTWGETAKLIKANTYELKENYRNTKEIALLCNAEFKINTVAMGGKGTRIRRVSLEEGIANLNNVVKKIPNAKVAVIKSGRYKKMDKYIKEKFPDEESWLKAGKQVSILTVELAKGLEFNAVLVIPHEMNERELYVAYTRALDNLMIVGR